MYRQRKFPGVPPSDGRLISATDDWKLYERSEVKGYKNYKLISVMPRLHKANYFLGFNVRDGKPVRTRDYKTLKANAPEVVEWIQLAIKGEG